MKNYIQVDGQILQINKKRPQLKQIHEQGIWIPNKEVKIYYAKKKGSYIKFQYNLI
ncbi:hypothetical protein [Bacillus cereus]|uniref:hypothetical protein n=1 Tax=Bacillus cereus TaxID=1396 RepID=UPI0018CFAA23|nr:hypothetical protein [Bacillus cereus]